MFSNHNKDVFATGAPGWLGTRLVEELAKTARVRCLVQKGVDAAPVTAFGAAAIEGDLTGAGDLAAALKGCGTVFHLAGLIHPKRISELYALNTDGTKRLLDAAIAAGVKRFVYVSSNSPAGVNSDPAKLLDEAALAPYKNYGISKRLAEEAVLDAARAGKIEGVIVRPCWFYGPGQPPRQTRFFKMIQAGNPIIFGTGEYLRSMSYVDNTVQGLILAAQSPKAPGQIYWIADERPYSVNEIYETIARLLGVKSFKPRHVPELASRVCGIVDDALQACGLYIQEFHVAAELVESIACTIEKAQRELGYRPAVSLEEGMRRSIDFCLKRGDLSPTAR